jgi:aminoglycoside phosphotransferase (APT) family kinase protein
LELLRADGVIRSPTATLTPLTGGVSSEIYRVHDGDDVFVVKRALPKLKVAQDWFADVGRNANEFKYMQYVDRHVPGAVPHVRQAHAEHGYFYANWKSLLLAGHAGHVAPKIGEMLGRIHAASSGDAAARDIFNTIANFEQLRIDPYLISTAKVHPALRHAIHAEASRLRAARSVLAHGDFSPKNILVAGDSVLIVDCEVAWFGDAAFDAAFMLNHLLLKTLIAGDHGNAARFWASYQQHAGRAAASEQTVTRLLLMLMLARVDGKSPAEYLNDSQRSFIRDFTMHRIPAKEISLQQLIREFHP